MNRFAFVIGIVAVAAGLGISGQAAAVTVTRDRLSHGVANCQAQLPVDDNKTRKRPLGFANEGSTTAFVTCDTEAMASSLRVFNMVQIYFVNHSTAAVTVNCIMVNTANAESNVLNTFPKSSGSIPVNSIGNVTWTTAQDGGPIKLPATSCGLPARVHITGVRFVYPEDVGA